MKCIISSAVFLLALFTCTPTFSTSYNVNLTSINCEAEMNGNICVVNATNFPITEIECEANLLGMITELAIPGGNIAQGQMTIVKFDRDACSSIFYVETSNHQIFKFNKGITSNVLIIN